MMLRAFENATAEGFEIPTRDGRTRLRGQVDLPVGGESLRGAAVLMVNGGWFMERDGFMGSSGTERDLLYRDLAGGLVAAGFTVLRYDNRGVQGNEMTMPPAPAGSGEMEITKHYVNACIDGAVRQTVSVQTQMDDVHEVWNFAVNHPRIDPARVVIWAHSEGGLNVGRLISVGRIDPRAVIFVGTATESPAAIFRYQTVDSNVAHVMSWDADGNGCVTPADVEREFPKSGMLAALGMTPGMMKPPDEGWTRESLWERFTRHHQETKAGVMAKADDAPYGGPTEGSLVVAASYGWFKQWYEDEKPMIDHLTEYRGPASFHLGGIDSQCPGAREMKFAEGRIKAGAFARAPQLVFHERRGHSLRTGEPTAGPMDEAAKAALVEEIRLISGIG